MGGYQLAEKLASDSAMGSYAGIILGAGLGCTLVFTIPVGMGMVKEENKPYFAKGIVLGLLGLPFALIIGGILSGLSIGRILWETVFPMSIAADLRNRIGEVLCAYHEDFWGICKGFAGNSSGRINVWRYCAYPSYL